MTLHYFPLPSSAPKKLNLEVNVMRTLSFPGLNSVFIKDVCESDNYCGDCKPQDGYRGAIRGCPRRSERDRCRGNYRATRQSSETEPISRPTTGILTFPERLPTTAIRQSLNVERKPSGCSGSHTGLAWFLFIAIKTHLSQLFGKKMVSTTAPGQQVAQTHCVETEPYSGIQKMSPMVHSFLMQVCLTPSHIHFFRFIWRRNLRKSDGFCGETTQIFFGQIGSLAVLTSTENDWSNLFSDTCFHAILLCFRANKIDIELKMAVCMSLEFHNTCWPIGTRIHFDLFSQFALSWHSIAISLDSKRQTL